MAFKDRRCLITGSSDPLSIGYSIAMGLMEGGAAHVTIMAPDPEKVALGVQQLKATGTCSKISGVIGDLKGPEQMKSVVESAVAEMGGLDALIISGGNSGSEYLGLDTQHPDSYRLLYDVAVLSSLFLTEAAIPELKRSAQARIEDGSISSAAAASTVVMVSSMAALVPWPDTAPYNLAKAAQNTLIETLAFKYRADGVRVNGVLPACIHTGALDRMAVKKNRDVKEYAAMRAKAHPMGKNGTPQEVANAVLFLASPASSFTTGTLLKVDGGLALSNWFNVDKLLAEYRGRSK